MVKVWKSFSFLVVVALALSLIAAAPMINPASAQPATSETAQIVVSYPFESLELRSYQAPTKLKVPSRNAEIPPPEQDAKGRDAMRVDDYVSVTMQGLPQWSETGLPVLPFKTARILLPYGAEVQNITVTCGDKISLPGAYLVEPGQKPVPLSYEGSVNRTLPDEEVYNSSTPFPGKLYSNATVQSKTGYSILLVNLHPVEYIPKTGKLSYYESMAVEVTLGAASEDKCLPIRGLSQDRKTIRDMVDNPEISNSYSESWVIRSQNCPLAVGAYEYVIITNGVLYAAPGPNNFQALRDNKISRGITATIVTTEWIYDNYNGTRPDGDEDNQTRIRNFIIDAYNTWGTRYVLLGGDGDSSDVGGESEAEIIPSRGFWCSIPEWGITDYKIPADMYYSCLDGTFDDNANGVYGEPDDGPGGGEVDLFAEVYAGRACVDSQTEVNNFVAKTLAYQNIDTTDENLKKVLLVGEYLGFGGVGDWGGNYKDEIKQGSSAHNYTTIGFENSPYAGSFDVSTLYDRDGSWPASKIISVINNNTHLINHLGHANINYVMKMYNSDVDNLTNEELYFIGYSQGCFDGAFDNGGTSYDCISEHLTTGPHGAVAFIANSRFGLGTSGSTDGASQHFDREFWDAVFGEKILNIGAANQDSKEDNAGRIGDSKDRWCYYEINLFGDPELSIKLYEGVVYDSHQIDDSAGGDNDGYPEPGESITMPVTSRNTATATDFLDVNATLTATTPFPAATIFSEDFEGSWPGNWSVGDWNPTSGNDYWGQSNYTAHSGNYSAYCAEVSDVPGQEYDNDMEAYMYRNVTLSAYDSATLSYYYTLNFRELNDYLKVGYYDGYWHWVKSYRGTTMFGFGRDSISVPNTATSVGFLFSSDSSVTYEGAYIDDVVLTGCNLAPDPYITITDNYEEYNNVTAGSISECDGYDFDINATCPDDHTVTFKLNITASNGGPWTDSFDVLIVKRHTISGQVRDLGTGDPIANATVYYSGPAPGNVTTNTTGSYTIPGLSFPSYMMYATASGYSDSDSIKVQVFSDVTGVDFELGCSDINVTPTGMEVWVLLNGTRTKNLTIANLGNYKLDFDIIRKCQGEAPGGDGEGGGSEETVESEWAWVTPTLDGNISAGEWDDAAVVDITATGIPNPVTMLIKNDCTYLYIAFADTNDLTHDPGDQVGIYFDEDHDGLWQLPPSGDSEGNFWVIDYGGGGMPADIIFRSIPDFNWYFGPAGVSGALSNVTGYMVYEAAIEFGTSPLDCVGGDTIGFYVFCLDYRQGSPTWIHTGFWPETSTHTDPGTYGALVLTTCIWLTIQPSSGTTAPANSTNVSVTFNATGLDQGDYHGNIIISNNDPDGNPTTVPVTMHVRSEGTFYDSHVVDDSAGGDNDGYHEPGESIEMPVTLRNTATATDFLDVNATLSATSSLPTTMFSDDMEAGEDGWTYDGLWNLTQHRNQTPTHSWYYGIEGAWDYDTGAANNGSLISPPVNLTGFDGATLSFWYWYETETNGTSSDQRWVNISVNGGPFQPLHQLYGDPMQMWNEKTIDLSSHAGNTIQIMFHFDTINATLNDFEGWYVDDVVITGYVPGPDPYITITDNFEQYNDIPAGGGTATCSGYAFDIAPACPDNHAMTFNLDIHASNGGPWTDSFDVLIVKRYAISGQVRDLGTGNPIANATLYYSGPSSGNVATSTNGSYEITGLPNGTYSIYATAPGYLFSDPVDVTAPPDTTGVDFELVNLNTAPNTPGNPSPGNHASGVSINTDLSWTGGDPDAADTVNYSVYFGTNSTPPFKETIGPYPANQTSLTYDPGTMSYNTMYHWKIVATDNHGASTEGAVWDFTTPYNLTISSTSGGNVTTPGEGNFTYNASEVVDIVATPDAGYRFVNWTGDVGTIDDVDSASTNITINGDYSLTANFVIKPAIIEGTIWQANTSLLPEAYIVLKLGGSEVANTTGNATACYNFTVNATGDYTINVTRGGFTSQEKWANVTALMESYTCDFKGMDAPFPTAPDGLYVIKCCNLWLYGHLYPAGFALDATRVSDVTYAWVHS